MLIEYIEEVRKRPYHARRRVAIMWSILFTGCIVLIWTITIIGSRPNPARTEASDTSSLNPISNFIDNVKSAFSAGDSINTETHNDVTPDDASNWNNIFNTAVPDSTAATTTGEVQPNATIEASTTDTSLFATSTGTTTQHINNKRSTATSSIVPTPVRSEDESGSTRAGTSTHKTVQEWDS